MLKYIRYYTLFLINQLNLNKLVKIYYCRNPHLLEHANKHERDKYIKFYEEGHKYDLTVNNKILNPISVTTFIDSFCDKFNADIVIKRMMASKSWTSSAYFGMFPDEIKDKWEINRNNAAADGTAMHLNIENYFNKIGYEKNSIEFKMFKQFWKDFKRKYPGYYMYRTEMTVFDEDFRDGKAICGSIDALLKNDKDEYMILDWKRSKEIKMNSFNREKLKFPFHKMDDCNFSKYTLQLNIYKHILKINYGFNIKALALVILHPNQPNYLCIKVNDINLDELWYNL